MRACDNAVFLAAKEGRENVLRVLLGRWMTVDSSTLERALIHAMKRGWSCIVDILLDYGASLGYNADTKGRNFVDVVKCGQVDAVTLLVNRRRSVLKADLSSWQAAHSSVKHGFTIIASCFEE